MRLCVLDFGEGAPGRRRLTPLVEGFRAAVERHNPGLAPALLVVDARAEAIPRGCELYLATGGPGAPAEDWDDPWLGRYRGFLDWLLGADAALFAICYAFEATLAHLGVARLRRLRFRKLGVMPVDVTEAGRTHPLLAGLSPRFLAYEQRGWEAVGLDEDRLLELDGQVLARERGTGPFAGSGALAVALPRIEGVQFHAEAEPEEILGFLVKPEWAALLGGLHGDDAYAAMVRACQDPGGLARLRRQVIPGWLTRAFNRLARARGYVELGG